MSLITTLVFWGWIPVVFYLFRRFPPQQAVVISFMVAWLFLPQISIILPVLPNINKLSITCYSILLVTAINDLGRFSSFRPSWLDLPMLIWCVCPFASSLDNGLGIYDGLSTTLAQTVTWGGPYFLGRIYLNNLAGLRLLAMGIFFGGLSYIPLCLIELRIGPQLDLWVYGFTTTTNWNVAIRNGGYRPVVFMGTGLMLGAWMMTATLTGIWLWKTGVIKQIGRIPMSWLVMALLVTFVSCKSAGASISLVLGSFILFFARWWRSTFPLWLLIASIGCYLFLGVNGNFPRTQIISYTSKVFNAERTQSLQFRFDNEVFLGEKARQKMIFGWGGFGRNRVYDENGKDLSITDSLWIIVFGTNGLVGLCSVTASMLLPVVRFFMLGYPAKTWSHPKVAPAAVLAVALTLYMLDCVLNAMINPMFALIGGAISGMTLQKRLVTKKAVNN